MTLKFFFLGMLLMAANLEAEDLAADEYDRRFYEAADAAERKYPALSDAGAPISILLEYKIKKARAAGDAVLSDPYFIMRFADAVAKEMAELGMSQSGNESSAEIGTTQQVERVAKESEESKLRAAQEAPGLGAPTAAQLAERKEQEAAAKGDVQAYLNQARKGHTGVDPKLQTRARSGDQVAQAEIDRHIQLKTIRAKLAAGYIDADEAQRERDAADRRYEAATSQLRLDEISEEVSRLRNQQQIEVNRQKWEDRRQKQR